MSQRDTPTQIIFPNVHDEIVKRTIILRNLSTRDFILKFSTSCPRSVILECSNFLVQARKYVEIPISYHPRDSSSHSLSIHLRPIETHNKESLKAWIKGIEQVKAHQLVCKMKIKTSNAYSAFETIIDLPGKASVYETAPVASTGTEDRDTFTCHPIDYGTTTVVNISPSDYANVIERQEKCWALGPLMDYLFPPASSSNNDCGTMNPCAGYA